MITVFRTSNGCRGEGGYSQRLLFNNVGKAGRDSTYPVTVKNKKKKKRVC
jgi:hypothetical protein